MVVLAGAGHEDKLALLFGSESLGCLPQLGAAQSVHIAAQLSRLGAGGGVIAIQPLV
jgi:hypothetical protein